MRLKPRASTRTWLVFAAAVVTVLPAATPAVAALPATPTALPHAVGGYQPGPVRTPAKSTPGGASASEVLPASVDLFPYAPPVGDQGRIGACVAWTIGYGIMGYYAKRTAGVGAPYAPLFLYLRNVAKGGAPNAGLIPDFVLANAQTAGVTTQADYWQGTTDWQTAPTPAQITNARNYRVKGWDRLFNGANQGAAAQTSIMRTLASGSPVALGIPVYKDFVYLRSHSLYSTVTGTSLGGHMIAAYGYDAQGVYIRNSWGGSWGNAGDAHLSWAFITKAATGAYAVNGITTPAAPLPAPVVTSVTPASGPTYKSTPVLVRGTDFTGVTAVLAGDKPVTFAKVSATELRVAMPGGTAGPRSLRIVTPGGTSAAGLASIFTYVAPPRPVITQLSVSSATTRVATPLTITGTGFAGATKVTVGDRPLAFSRVSEDQLKVTVPARTAAGLAALTVTGPGGTSEVVLFAFVAPTAKVRSRG